MKLNEEQKIRLLAKSSDDMYNQQVSVILGMIDISKIQALGSIHHVSDLRGLVIVLYEKVRNLFTDKQKIDLDKKVEYIQKLPSPVWSRGDGTQMFNDSLAPPLIIAIRGVDLRIRELLQEAGFFAKQQNPTRRLN